MNYILRRVASKNEKNGKMVRDYPKTEKDDEIFIIRTKCFFSLLTVTRWSHAAIQMKLTLNAPRNKRRVNNHSCMCDNFRVATLSCFDSRNEKGKKTPLYHRLCFGFFHFLVVCVGSKCYHRRLSSTCRFKKILFCLLCVQNQQSHLRASDKKECVSDKLIEFWITLYKKQ